MSVVVPSGLVLDKVETTMGKSLETLTENFTLKCRTFPKCNVDLSYWVIWGGGGGRGPKTEAMLGEAPFHREKQSSV